jgi:ABC-type glycerol-3-phosphate transport system substrate-binding protein
VKLFKVLSVLILLLAVPALVFAAGQDEAVEVEEGQQLVRVLVPRWASTGDVRVERQVAFQSVIDSFEAANPNVRVQEVISSASSYDVDVATQIEEGTVEVVWVNNPFYPTLQARGLFADLDPHLSDEDEADFFQWTLDALRSVNGELGGLWHNTDVRLFFYRDDLISQAPDSVEAFLEIARDISENEDLVPFHVSLGHTDGFIPLYGLFHSLGGEIVDDEGRPVALEGQNREYWEQIFQTMEIMFDEGLVPESTAVSRENAVVPLLLAGEVASFIANSNYGVREINPKLPEEEAALWQASPTFGYEGTDGRGVSGGWVYSARRIEDDPALQQAAIDFVLHATNFSSLRNTTKAGGWVPTRSSVFTGDTFFSEDRFMVATAEALENSTVRPLVPMSPIIAQVMMDAMSVYLTTDESLESVLDGAADTLEAEWNSL